MLLPGTGAAPPLGSFIFKNMNLLSVAIYFKFLPLKDFVTEFALQTHRRPNLALSLNRPRSTLKGLSDECCLSSFKINRLSLKGF